jgi:transposase-like protein
MIRFIEQVVLQRGSICPLCNSAAVLSKSRSERSICSEKLCKKRFNILKNTIFSDAKLDKIVILRVLELWMQKASINLISYILEINKKSIYEILKKVSNILVPKYYDSLEKDFIGGDCVVEIDESKFGKRKYSRGHHVDGVWVLGMIERTGQKRIRLYTLDNRSRETLDNIINENVSSESTIFTDMWKGYNGLKFKSHKKVNHSKNFKDPQTGVHTNRIEGSWFGVKMHIPPRGRTKDKIKMYLVRYMILKNSSIHPFWELIKYLF